MRRRIGLRFGAFLLATLAPPLGFGSSTAMAGRPRPPTVKARARALIDARTGEVLTSHAAKRHLLIASTTKLMTAWVVLHELALGMIVRAEDRFSDNLKPLEYGFSLYRRQAALGAGQALADPAIRYAGGELPLVCPRTVRVAIRPSQRLTVKVRAPKEVQGPIHSGAVLGRAKVLLDGDLVAVIPLRAGRSLPSASAIQRAGNFVSTNAIPLVEAGFVILIRAPYLWRRRRHRGDGEERVLVRRVEMPAAGDRSRGGG